MTFQMQDSQKASYTKGTTDEDEAENYKMGLTGCGKFLKYSMFLFNAFILIAGCGLLGFGAYTRSSSQQTTVAVYNIIGKNLVSILSLVLIASGGLVIFLSFLGCCGAIKEVRCMLVTFFILLFVMLIGLLIGGIVIYAYRQQIGDHVLKELYTSLNTTYKMPGHEKVTEAWNFMQTLFSCCGVYGDINSTTSWYFYRNTAWFHNQTEGMVTYVPDSCCRNAIGSNRSICVEGTKQNSIIPALEPPVLPHMENALLFTEGCYSAFITFLADNIKIVGGVCGGIAVMMILAMTFAVCLCRRIQDDYFFD